MQEQYFAPISRYSNSNLGMPVNEVEAWLDQFPQKRSENKPNGGIIRSTADTKEMFLRPMNSKDRAAAIAQARRDHKQALKNLAKQEAVDAKQIAKQLTVWRRENKAKLKVSLSVVGQEVFKTLIEKGFYKPSDFTMSPKYMRSIITQIIAMGYDVKRVRKGRTITRYVLSKKFIKSAS